MNTKMKVDNLCAKNVRQVSQDMRECSLTPKLFLNRTNASNVQQGGLDEVIRGIFQTKLRELLRWCGKIQVRTALHLVPPAANATSQLGTTVLN